MAQIDGRSVVVLVGKGVTEGEVRLRSTFWVFRMLVVGKRVGICENIAHAY